MKKTTGILLAGILSVCMAGGALAAEETGIDEIALLEQRMIQLYQGYQYLAEDNGVDRILDLSGLERIRREALITRDSLLTEEEREDAEAAACK